MSSSAQSPKVCAKCAQKNAAAKNYCDRCGASLAAGNSLPPAGRAEFIPLPEAPAAAPRTGPRTGPRTAAKTGSRRAASRKVIATIAGPLQILAIAAAAGAGIYRYYAYFKPENAIPRAVEAYLTALSRWDAGEAYALLSSPTRANCTLEEFQALQEATSWTWSDASIVKRAGQTALVRYTRLAEGRAPRQERLFLTLEAGAWRVAFNNNLLRDSETALSLDDPDIAIMRAQAAVRVNEADPLARSALCRAYQFRRLKAEADQECEQAAKLGEMFGFPVENGGRN